MRTPIDAWEDVIKKRLLLAVGRLKAFIWWSGQCSGCRKIKRETFYRRGIGLQRFFRESKKESPQITQITEIKASAAKLSSGASEVNRPSGNT
jgi:hypothetical protein